MVLDRRQIAIGTGRAVSAVVAHPEAPASGPSTTVIVAHGAGNDMNSPFLSAVHEGLAACGYCTVKFNFPYKEHGRRAPDPSSVLEACYRRVVAAVRDDPQIAPRRLVIGGKSLGGRIASHLAASGEDVTGLLFLGYPLHPAGQVDRLRSAHLDRIRVPMLFFVGTRDPLCRLELLQRTVQQLPAPTTVHIIEGGDHSFDVPKALRRDRRSIWNEIVTVSAQWLQKLPM
jgi:predicted alpha/beta-hydrolase family hydrolase